MLMKKPFVIALISLLATAQAQDADSILTKVEATQKAARDVSFRLSGTVLVQAQQPQNIDMMVQSVPDSNVTRLVFNAPDVLADNIVVLDGKEVRQYLYLTNQVTVTTLGKPSQNKGPDLSGLDVSQFNASALKNRYDLKLLGSSGASGNRVYQLQATPKTGSSKTLVWVSEKAWQPTRFQILNNAGKVQADLNVSNYKLNSGLSAAKLRSLPKDAEVVRQ